MQVKDIMTKRAFRIGQDEPASVAARMLARYNIGALPVCNEAGKITGMITDRDIVLRCVAADRDPDKIPVKNIMTTKIVTVRADMTLEDASAKMAREQVRRLPVEDHGQLCGMLSISDLIHAPNYAEETAAVLEQIFSGISSR